MFLTPKGMMMNATMLPLTVPTCDCCTEPAALLARRDVADGLWVCPDSGHTYRVMGDRLLRTPMPTVAPVPTTAPTIRIDLSRSGYA
jgi:hypothetical protein